MTAGICHEINNSLSAVLLATAAVIRKIETLPALGAEVDLLGKARLGAERIGKVIEGLKLFLTALPDW